MFSFKFQFFLVPFKFLKLTNEDWSITKACKADERSRMWENSAAAFPIQGRRLVPHVELFNSSFTLNYAFKLLFECLFFFLQRWGQIPEGCLLWLLGKKSLRIVWKENSQVALILFRTFRSTALPPQTLFCFKTRTWHETSVAICQTSLHCCFFCLCFPYLSTWRMHRSTFHTSTALSLDKTNPQNCTCQLFRWDEKNNTDLFFMLGHFSKCLIYLNIKKKKILP